MLEREMEKQERKAWILADFKNYSLDVRGNSIF
jgi:hypothetical protein